VELISIEQAILEQVRSLPPAQQQAILDFAEFLVQQSQKPKHQWSSDFLSTFGAWKGTLIRLSQEVDEYEWSDNFLAPTYGICVDDPILIDNSWRPR
jgi:hypothetical protein